MAPSEPRRSGPGGGSWDAQANLLKGMFSRRGAKVGPGEDDPAVAEARKNRRVNQRQALATGGGGRGGSSLSFATGRPRDPLFYWRQNNLPWDTAKDDELKKIREYCSDPNEPVWMGDYSFKPIGEVQVGDEVVAWTKVVPGEKSRLVRATVLATHRRTAPETVRVTTESGRTWVGTPDHRFANPFYSSYVASSGWQQPEFVNPQVGKVLRHVIDSTEPLADEKTRLVAAWLGGVYDGEGCGESIGQSRSYNPAVCERIEASLDLLGLPHTADANSIYIRRQGSRLPAKQAMVDFLNWTQPTRRTSNAIDNRILTRVSGSQDRIVSVEPLGPGEVVSMETTTGTYVVSGFASSNCRLLYQSHPVIASCIDIYSKYPLLGMELTCKDEQLTDFYSDLFLSKDNLNYGKFLIDLGREYWTVGEAWPFASFNEVLGVWEDEELLNPDDCEVVNSPLMKDPRFLIRLPETLRRVIEEQSPRWEFEKLMADYPELKDYAGTDALMPVSNILLHQMKFEADTFNKRGIPILMRAFRAIMQEEMLNAAMDSIADRLYTPLILVRLGASATDLGTSAPWIPTEDDLADFEEALDGALAADFRALVHHFGVQMEPVFGRENMPDMTNDFDRLEGRILQSFGLSQTMLSGADGGETYAADALNRDLVSQLLTTYQDMVKGHYEDRAMVVAEAQEHFDYEVRNGKRYVKMEEILEVDEESGEERIVEQPKLLIPEMIMKTMNIKDESAEREFLEQLRASGVPVSIKTRMINIPFDMDEEIERTEDEQVRLAVAEQETRKRIYIELRTKGLPIPEDLRADFEPKAMQAQEDGDAGAGARTPMLGTDQTASYPNLSPTVQDMAADQAGDGSGDGSVDSGDMGAQMGGGMAAAMAPDPSVPPESNEQRAGMPTASHLRVRASRMRVIAEEHHDPMVQKIQDEAEKPQDRRPYGKFGDPKHVGMRRFASVRPKEPMEDWYYDDRGE